jgi:hypothetical protein
MQVHRAAYDPTPDAINGGAITECLPPKVVPGVVRRLHGQYSPRPIVTRAHAPRPIVTRAHVPRQVKCGFIQPELSETTTCIEGVAATEALWSDRDYAWVEAPAEILSGAWTCATRSHPCRQRNATATNAPPPPPSS